MGLRLHFVGVIDNVTHDDILVLLGLAPPYCLIFLSFVAFFFCVGGRGWFWCFALLILLAGLSFLCLLSGWNCGTVNRCIISWT